MEIDSRALLIYANVYICEWYARICEQTCVVAYISDSQARKGSIRIYHLHKNLRAQFNFQPVL